MAADREGVGLASSLTDLMTSLAVIFILLLVASHNNEQQEIDTIKADLAVRAQEAEDLQAERERMLQELQEARERTDATRSHILLALRKALASFAAQGVEAQTDDRDPLHLLVIVPEGLLNFAWGKAEIPPGGVEFLRSLTPKLAATVCSEEDVRKEISAITIEGHTDSSGTEANNLQLSQARAMAVARKVLDMLSDSTTASGNPSTSRNCLLTLLSASGRGSSDLIKNGTTGREDPERSRRVVFKIRVRSLEQRRLQEALGVDSSLRAVKTL